MSLQGEWWIDDSGFVTYADGDVGDVNHESLAFYMGIGVDTAELYNATQTIKDELTFIYEWAMKHDARELEEFKEEFSDEEAPAELAMRVQELGVGDFDVMTGATLVALDGNEEGIEYFMTHKNVDARDYQIEKNGWIRVQNNNFQLWKLDDNALSRIQDMILEEYPEGENFLEDEFFIEELKPKGQYVSMTGDELVESGKSAGALLYAARRERGDWYNPSQTTRRRLRGHK